MTMEELMFCVAFTVVAIAGLIIVKNITNITKRKIEIVAVLYGMVGIILLYLSFLMFKQALWGLCIGHLFLAATIIAALFPLKKKYQQINN